VDRVKNLVKLKGGEYIAIENMEKEYQTSPYVNGLNGGIMCFGDGDMDRPVALVQANVAEVGKWAKQQGMDSSDVESLCRDKKVEAMVLKSLVDAGKGKLGGNEILVAIKLVPGTGPMDAPTVTSPWTPENGFQTASKKLNRRPIQDAFKAEMAELKKAGTR